MSLTSKQMTFQFLQKTMESSLYKNASDIYDEHELGELPSHLQRNSLDYYYLSVYPSLKGMQTLDEDGSLLPQYPESISSAYLHVPFCSGLCDFCSYFTTVLGPDNTKRIDKYLELVKTEIDYHRLRTSLQISYIYFGGGTPSLIPPDTLKRFLDHITEKSIVSPELQGTVELHPEFFHQRNVAQEFLNTLKSHGIKRVSLGFESASEKVLSSTNRRHDANFLTDAISLLKDNKLCVNLDLMYGLPGLSHDHWERTLNCAVDCDPDSISTYFLFVDQGTATWRNVLSNKINLPSNRTSQIQHIMAQTFLKQKGFHELPNDFYSKVHGDPNTFTQESLPSSSKSLPIGAGAYGYYDGTQFYNQFDLNQYEAKVITGCSPIWRGHRLDEENQIRRDIMFSLKNYPSLNKQLFIAKYGTSPENSFPGVFHQLIKYGLIQDNGSVIKLTEKGSLCVEEICTLFIDHDLLSNGDPGRSKLENAKIEKHNFSPNLRIHLPLLDK